MKKFVTYVLLALGIGSCFAEVAWARCHRFGGRRQDGQCRFLGRFRARCR